MPVATKKSLNALERMTERGSENLDFFRDERDKWLKVLGGDEKQYEAVQDAAEFLDYIDPEIAGPLMEGTSKLLLKMDVEEYDRRVCDIACAASRDRRAAKELLYELLETGREGYTDIEGLKETSQKYIL